MLLSCYKQRQKSYFPWQASWFVHKTPALSQWKSQPPFLGLCCGCHYGCACCQKASTAGLCITGGRDRGLSWTLRATHSAFSLLWMLQTSADDDSLLRNSFSSFPSALWSILLYDPLHIFIIHDVLDIRWKHQLNEMKIMYHQKHILDTFNLTC